MERKSKKLKNLLCSRLLARGVWKHPHCDRVETSGVRVRDGHLN